MQLTIEIINPLLTKYIEDDIFALSEAFIYNNQVKFLNLYKDYLLPFELVSVLFFVAMVGAVMLGKREAGERNF